jgi:hypothetical protein
MSLLTLPQKFNLGGYVLFRNAKSTAALGEPFDSLE